MIVDFHCHIQPKALRDLQVDDGDCDFYGITVRRDPHGQIAYTVADHSGRLTHPPRHTLQDRVDWMDERGIDVQVLSMSPSLAQYRTAPAVAAEGAKAINDDFAEIAARWPDRFKGFAPLPLQDPAASVTELERAMSNGLVGTCVHTHVNGLNWDDDTLFPILEAAQSP